MMLFALVLSLSLAQAEVTGTVKDSSGGTVSGASVVIRTPSGDERQTVTGPDGRFSFEDTADGSTLIVRAGGFAVHEQPLTEGQIEVVLEPARRLDTVLVTPTRTEERLGNVPASVSVLRSDEIERSPAVVADDVLRQIPTFSLFRRTSSLSSHPTAQGVSLRGIGPSGVSRTLVLLDGAPFNDPFGGWVYWTRVPLESADRIEVVDGSSSSLYGNYAMGGVINIVTGRATPRTIELKPQLGNRDTQKLDVFGSDVWGRVGVALDASVFRTDGFPIVSADERGIIDNNAWVHFGNVNVKVDYSPTDRINAYARAGYFDEDRSNGKIEEVNDTRLKTVTGGLRVRMPDESTLQGRLFVDDGDFHAKFLAVSSLNEPRDVVRLTVNQRVPTESIGGLVQWSKVFTSSHLVSAGLDWRHIDGDSREDVYFQDGPVRSPITASVLSLQRVLGGTQRSVGVYAQDVFTPIEPVTITASVRVDNWQNYDAHAFETNAGTGQPTANNRLLDERDDTVASPRVAVMYRVNNRLSVWGAVSSGFRAPTLNELYRGFRVGAIQTLANEALGPERLVGGEAGLNVALTPELTVRSTWYDNRIRNPISNVTIGENLQQRQNLGRTKVQGIQTDAEYVFGSSVRVSAGYLYNSAKVTENDREPDLIGKFLAQVPRHRGSFQVTYTEPSFANVSFGVQYIGRQFDDDQNSRIVPGEDEPGLPGYALADLMVSRALTSNIDLFFGVQNLFDEEYFVGTLPTTIGTPRLVNGGVRIKLSDR